MATPTQTPLSALVRRCTSAWRWLAAAALLCLSGCATYTDDEQVSSAPLLKYQVDSFTAELDALGQRLSILETTIAILEENITSDSETARHAFHSKTDKIAERISSLEGKAQGLGSDLGTVKSHANELASALKQCRSQLQTLDRNNNKNSDNIHNLDSAMRSLMDLVDPSKGQPRHAIAARVKSDSGRVYKVRPGDTLEKIARRNSTSIEAIKELNNLRSEDLIIVGQELMLP